MHQARPVGCAAADGPPGTGARTGRGQARVAAVEEVRVGIARPDALGSGIAIAIPCLDPLYKTSVQHCPAISHLQEKDGGGWFPRNQVTPLGCGQIVAKAYFIRLCPCLILLTYRCKEWQA